MVTAAQKLLLSQREVAEALSVSESTVINLRRSGTLPFVKLGKSVRFRVEDVRQLAENLPATTATR